MIWVLEGGWGQKMCGGDVIALPLEEVRSKDGEGLRQERVTRHAVERVVGVCSSGIDQARMKILFRWLDMSATVRPTTGRLCESSVSGDAKVVKALARNGLPDTVAIDCVCSSGIDQARMKILFRWLDMSATVRPTTGRLCVSPLSVVM